MLTTLDYQNQIKWTQKKKKKNFKKHKGKADMYRCTWYITTKIDLREKKKKKKVNKMYLRLPRNGNTWYKHLYLLTVREIIYTFHTLEDPIQTF